MKYLLLLMLFACTMNATLQAQNTHVIQETEKATDSMIFLTYYILKTPEKGLKVDYKKNILAKGRIKGFHEAKALHKTSYLVCELLDKDLQVIETLYLKNPLEKIVEFVNDSGNLEKRLIPLDETDFTFRMPYNQNVLYAKMGIISNTDTTNFTITKL